MSAGTADLARAADLLAARVPEPLAPLARLAYNYRWSWAPGGPELFQAVDPDRWERCGENPVRLLQEAHPASLERAAADTALHERIAAVQAEVEADLARPDAEGDSVAYFCAEFGVHRSLPIYSGGLGVLAGDILKEASDLALPLSRRRPHVPPGLLPPADRRAAAGSTSTGSTRTRSASRPRSSAATTASR